MSIKEQAKQLELHKRNAINLTNVPNRESRIFLKVKTFFIFVFNHREPQRQVIDVQSREIVSSLPIQR